MRSVVPHAWGPFFARYGRVTEVQALAIPRILEGASVIVAAPTATGKTEAVVAPVAELLAGRPYRDALDTVYVVPTRALANDTMVRISEPLAEMGFRAWLRHGEHSYLPNRDPHFMVTTPESLDSLICRRPKLFLALSTVIVDEVHLLDGTYRGDQMRVLIRRLCNLYPERGVRVHLLSATVGDPVEVGARYDADIQPVVSHAGGRALDVNYAGTVRGAVELAKTRRWGKLLFFCNSRRRVEEVANEVRPLWAPYPAFAHHGSLSRQERQKAEQTMREARVAACVATSTLEVGIDIGNIDAVVLAEMPWSLSALAQRIGRGNRRSGRITVVVATGAGAEDTLLEGMLNLAAAGGMPAQVYTADLSVVVQQTFSSLFARRAGIEEQQLVDIVAPLCEPDDARAIWRHLEETGWMSLHGTRWLGTQQVMDLDRRGEIHTNIPDDTVHKVIDAMSQREVGTVVGEFDKTFILAGRGWQVVGVRGFDILARRVEGVQKAAAFHPSRAEGRFAHLLPGSMRRRG